MGNKENKIFLITRIKELEEIDYLKKWLKVFLCPSRKSKTSRISKIFIISDKKYNSIKEIAPDRIEVIKHEDPTSPISMNKAIRNRKFTKEKPKSFIIISKEVTIGEENIEELISELDKDNNILCVGYKFKIIGIPNKYNEELKNYYENEELIAYRVPWNTCIIWNYDLFKEYIVKFDEICNKNPFGKLNVCVDDVVKETKYQGMEDGLAIAKAASNEKAKIKFKLLNKDKCLNWEIKEKDILKNRIKLKRKNEVLLNFMTVRDYSVDDLLKAKED